MEIKKNTTLSEQFQYPFEKWYKEAIATTLIHIYSTAQIPSLEQALQ
jgi:hypothetical protein